MRNTLRHHTTSVVVKTLDSQSGNLGFNSMGIYGVKKLVDALVLGRGRGRGGEGKAVTERR